MFFVDSDSLSSYDASSANGNADLDSGLFGFSMRHHIFVATVRSRAAELPGLPWDAISIAQAIDD